MDKRVILAVAGSGKTYTLVNSIDEKKRNVIIAYTKENIKNIEKELIKRFNRIPKYTQIYTFHKFVYNFLIRPYENQISQYFNTTIKSKGLCFDIPQKAVDRFGNYNKNYKLKKDYKHYLKIDRYYSSLISELVNYLDKENLLFISRALNTINYFFDSLYIDEFQDFREENYKLLEKIIKLNDNVLLVGDYYQHSVNAVNNSGIPFQKKGNNVKYIITYNEYKEVLRSLHLNIDETSLIKSRRCSEEVCNFVSKKLKIQIESAKINKGIVEFLNDEDKVREKLNDDNIVKLVIKEPYSWNFNAMSWGYSKGDTYSDIVVILTDKFNRIAKDDFSTSNIPQTTINKLYVAMTRTDRNLYLIKFQDFKKVKTEYQINLKK